MQTVLIRLKMVENSVVTAVGLVGANVIFLASR